MGQFQEASFEALTLVTSKAITRTDNTNIIVCIYKVSTTFFESHVQFKKSIFSPLSKRQMRRIIVSTRKALRMLKEEKVFARVDSRNPTMNDNKACGKKQEEFQC